MLANILRSLKINKFILVLCVLLFVPDCVLAQVRGVLVKDGKAVNVVTLPTDWTGAVGEWQAPADATVITATGGAIGDDYDGIKFIKFVFVNRDAGGNITRITSTRQGPAQERIRRDQADVLAFRATQEEISSEKSLIETREKAILKRQAKQELEAEGVIFKHN